MHGDKPVLRKCVYSVGKIIGVFFLKKIETSENESRWAASFCDREAISEARFE